VQQMTCGFDIQEAMQDIPNILEKSVILFHAYAHDSTGVDPKTEQWIEISKVFQQKKLFPFFFFFY
jgi:aspartate aminotransferase